MLKLLKLLLKEFDKLLLVVAQVGAFDDDAAGGSAFGVEEVVRGIERRLLPVSSDAKRATAMPSSMYFVR